MDRNVDRSFKVIKEGKDSHNSQVSQEEQDFYIECRERLCFEIFALQYRLLVLAYQNKISNIIVDRLALSIVEIMKSYGLPGIQYRIDSGYRFVEYSLPDISPFKEITEALDIHNRFILVVPRNYSQNEELKEKE